MAAVAESIGGVSVSIEGDLGPLKTAFAAAQASAEQAGASVAAAFTSGASTIAGAQAAVKQATENLADAQKQLAAFIVAGNETAIAAVAGYQAALVSAEATLTGMTSTQGAAAGAAGVLGAATAPAAAAVGKLGGAAAASAVPVRTLTGSIQQLIIAQRLMVLADIQAAEAAELEAAALVTQGAAAHGSGFNMRYAFLALKDVAEGRSVNALAEVANEFTRLQGTALAAGLAIGALVVVGYGIAKLEDFLKNLNEAALVVRAAFAGMNAEGKLSNDELIVTNDKLENAIAKIEHKPVNGIKLALDEAIVAAGQLGQQLDKNLTALKGLVEKNSVSIIGQVFGQAGTADIDTELRNFQRKVADVTSKSAIPRQESIGGVSILSPELLNQQKIAAQTATNTELARLYTAEVEKVGHLLQNALRAPSDGSVDAAKRIEILAGALQNLQQQQGSIGIKTTGGDLEGEQALAQQKAEANRLAAEAGRKATEELRHNDEERLAELKSQHALSVGEVIKYWVTRREVESSNATRLREITITLGNLYQEQDKVIERVSAHGAKLIEDQTKKVQARAKLLTNLVEEALALNDKIGVGGTDETARAAKLADIRAGGAANDAQAKGQQQKLLLERAYGLEIIHTGAQQIAYETELNAIDSVQRSAKEAKLQTDLNIATALGDQAKILEAQVALDKQLGIDANERIADETRIAQLKQQQSLHFQVQRSVADAGKAVPGALGGALATGAMHGGKGLGQDIAQALKGVGQQLLGSVFTSIIHQLIGSILANTAVQAVMQAVFGASVATEAVLTTALGANAVASGALVVSNSALAVAVTDLAIATWMSIAFLGFADGGSPPIGVPSMVGEKGAELFIPKEAGVIIPNHQLGSFAGGVPSLPAVGPSSSSSSSSIGQMNFHIHGAKDTRETVRAIAGFLKNTSPKYSPLSR